MGIGRERFVEPENIPENYICQICLEVLENPYSVCLDDHLYCKTCSDQFYQNQNQQQQSADMDGRVFMSFNCPVCKDTKSYHRQHFRASKFASRLVGQLKISCLNKEHGCKWTGELSNEAGHLLSCSRRIIGCPNGCGDAFRANQLRHHVLKDCEEQLLVCPRGKLNCQYSRCEKATHPEECEFWKCRSSKECPTTGTLSMLRKHEPYCLEIHEKLTRAQSTTGIKQVEEWLQDCEADLSECRDELSEARELLAEIRSDNLYLEEQIIELEEERDARDEEEDYDSLYDKESYLDEIYSALAEQAESMNEPQLRINERDEEIKRLEKEIRVLKSKIQLNDNEDLELLHQPVNPAFGVVAGVKRSFDEAELSNLEEDGSVGVGSRSNNNHASSNWLNKMMRLG